MAMEEGCRSTQLVYGNGEFNATGLSSFIKSVKLSKCGVSYAVVAIMGPQSSGKSVLLNHLFGTDFVVMDATKGRSQTTKGIWIAKADDVEPLTIVLDIEGNDGQERGEDQTFERQSAMFALAVADVVLINIWCKDIGRESGAGKPILRTVFEVMAKLSISVTVTPRKTTLLFVLRDKTTKTPLDILEKQLIESTENIWMEVRKPKARKNSALSDFFTVKVTALPNYEEKELEFKEEVAKLKKKFQNSIAPGGLAGDRQAGVVDASGFEFSAQEMWKDIRKNKDLDLPTYKVAVASFRCDEVFTEISRRFREDERWLKIETEAKSSPLLIPEFGKELSSILETFLSMYDKETEYFEVRVRDAKRETLEFNLVQVVRPAYETLLDHLLSRATESFKTQLDEELSSGKKGFATSVHECVTSCMAYFDKRCADAKIQQDRWDKHSSINRDKLECKIKGHSSYVRDKKLSEIVTRLEKKLSDGRLEDETVSFLEKGNKDSWPSIRKLLCNELESVSSEFNRSIPGFKLEESRRVELLQGLKNHATRIVEKAARDTAKTQRVLFHMKNRFSSLLHHDHDSDTRPRVNASKWFPRLVRLGGRDSRHWNGDEGINEIVSYATRECVGLLSVMAAIRLGEQQDNIESRLISSFLPNNKKYYPLDFNPFAFWNGDRNDNSSWDKVSPDYILITPLKCDEIREQFLSDISKTVKKFRETLVSTANSSCEEIAGEILKSFRADKRWLDLIETAAAKSPGFGKQLSSLLETFLSMYDKETELEVFNHQGVRDAKRKKLESNLLQLVRPAYETQLKHLISTAAKMFETQLDETLREKKLGLTDSVDECRNSCMHQFDEWCADAAIKQAEADCRNASKMAKATLSRKISEHSRSVHDKKLSEIIARLKKKLSDDRLEDRTVSFLEQGNKDSCWPSIRKLLCQEIESVSSEFKGSISEFKLEESMREDILQKLKNYATGIVEKAARDTAKRVRLYMKDRFSDLFKLDQDSNPRLWKGDENIEEIVSYATRQCAELLYVMAAIRLDEQPDDNNHIVSCLSAPEFDGNAEEGSPITNYVDCWNKDSPHYTILTPTECRKIWDQFMSDIQPAIDHAVETLAAYNEKAANKFRHILGSVLRVIAPLASVIMSIVGMIVD